MSLFKKLALTAAGVLLASTAIAQTPVVPQVQSIGPNDLFQDVVNGVPQAQSFYASAAMLAGSLGGTSENFLIGGDQNLFQRQLSTTAVTGGTGATVVYTADRWFDWEAVAGSTAVNVVKSTTAATLGPGASSSMLFKLTNSQTGTAQVCHGQVISNANSAALAGHTVELDFNVYAGATYTGASQNAYIIYGTDATDTGSGAMAFGLNANSNTATAWAGQANATVGAFTVAALSTLYREMAVANIPTTATEVGVAICFTPSGTSSGTGATDGLYLSNVELRKNDFLANWANATTAYSVNTSTNAAQATINSTPQTVVVSAFSRRTPMTEALLQYSYYYLIAEENTAGNVQGNGASVSTTVCNVLFNFPAPMRSTPTLLITAQGGYAALSATTFKIADSTATPIVLATTWAAIPTNGIGVGNTNGNVGFITAASQTVANSCSLISTASGGGAFAFTAEE